MVQKGNTNGKKVYSRDFDNRENPCNLFLFILDNNKNYEIGGSLLSHNPILNPVNNFNYNKYISNNIPTQPQMNNYNYSENYNSNMNNYYPNYENTFNNNNNMNNLNNLNNNTNITPSTGERLRLAANSMMR